MLPVYLEAMRVGSVEHYAADPEKADVRAPPLFFWGAMLRTLQGDTHAKRITARHVRTNHQATRRQVRVAATCGVAVIRERFHTRRFLPKLPGRGVALAA